MTSLMATVARLWRLCPDAKFQVTAGQALWLALWSMIAGASAGDLGAKPAVREFAATGLVKEIRQGEQQLVIAHHEIGGYMGAMTMPFNVQNRGELQGLAPGDSVSFLLDVTDDRSWIRQIRKLPREGTLAPEANLPEPAAPSPHAGTRSAVLDFPFTNELGRPVRLSDFKGQALAVTFFFTRCPIPEFCPRLSKNFQAASQKLAALANGPTNWHFLSVSFDTAFDTPAVLKQYAESYHYDPKHWSFLTGPAEQIAALASGSDVTFTPDNGGFNHNFRTLIIDARGHVQTVFPTGGDLANEIAAEMLKAAAAGLNPTTDKP